MSASSIRPLIATPHSLHGPIGLVLLPLGIHVLMEKPQLAAAARAAGVVLAVGSGGTCTWPSGSSL
jgi:predicted dehydrogenase